jgi:RluA family pseudouridine synthase
MTTIKLSSAPSAPSHQFWEIPVLFEDDSLLAIDKPSGLATSPENPDSEEPNLLSLLHSGIRDAKPWARERGLTFLTNVYRLDPEVSGALLMAKSKDVSSTLANTFGSAQVIHHHLALVQGAPDHEQMDVTHKLAPHPARPGRVHVDPKHGKRSHTRVAVQERFDGWSLLQCDALTNRPHQIRVHLRYVGLPLVGDSFYGGRPLLLSRLKSDYRLKPNQRERPLLGRPALHSESLTFAHPLSGSSLTISAPLPKDFSVALKYLRRYRPALITGH